MNNKNLLLALFFVSISISCGRNIQTIKINAQDLSTDLKGVYGNIQSFFNSIFNNAINLEIVDGTMKTISGGITFVKGSQTISPGHTVFVTIEDVSIADAGSIKLAQSVYLNPKKFPLDFSVDIDSKLIKPYGSYSLSVRIEKDGELRYISDTYTPVTDEDNTILEYPILVNVVKVPILLQSPNDFTTIRGDLFSSDSDCRSSTNQIIRIAIQDVSLMDAPSVEIASKEYKIGKSCRLPFSYEFQFDASEILKSPWRSYTVSASIIEEDTDQLKFVSDYNNPILNGTNIIEKINIHMVKIPPYIHQN